MHLRKTADGDKSVIIICYDRGESVNDISYQNVAD